MRLAPVNCNKMICLTILATLMQLSACNHHFTTKSEKPKRPYKLCSACDATTAHHVTTLNRRDVRVITLGQDYLISISANALFEEQAPRLTWKSYKLLNEVAAFLKQFPKVAITITSYSSTYDSIQREQALTLARARIVGDYLWSQGLDSRFIFTQGMGSSKPIVHFKQSGDSSANARIEITFRDVVA